MLSLRSVLTIFERGSLFAILLAASASGCRAAPEERAVASEQKPTPAEEAPKPKPEPQPEPAEPEFQRAGPLFFVETVSGQAKPDDELPMIVAIHGLGDDPRSFAGLLVGFDQPARIILPRAVDAWEGGGWSWFPVRAGDGEEEKLAEGIAKAADVVAAGVAELQKTRPTVGKPIVTGFSQGGMVTFELAVHHPEQFSAAFPVGGWLPPPLWPEEIESADNYPPIVALHGEEDPAVKFIPTQDGVKHLDKLGLDAQLHAYPGVRHAIPPEMHQELMELLHQARAKLVPEAK
jgi:phospholipase/carboxylesterase